jgi:hypothetical protein
MDCAATPKLEGLGWPEHRIYRTHGAISQFLRSRFVGIWHSAPLGTFPVSEDPIFENLSGSAGNEESLPSTRL